MKRRVAFGLQATGTRLPRWPKDLSSGETGAQAGKNRLSSFRRSSLVTDSPHAPVVYW